MNEVDQLTKALDQLTAEVITDRKASELKEKSNIRARESADRKSFWAFVVGVIGVLSGVVGIYSAHNASDDLHEFLARRNVALVNSCKDSNETYALINKDPEADIATLTPIRDAAMASTDSRSLQAVDFYNARIAQYEASIVQPLNCSLDAINARLEQRDNNG